MLGANGSRRTTLLRCLSGALAPASGIVAVDEVRLQYTRGGLRSRRQEAQLVLQNSDDQLFSASVAQDVSFGPLGRGAGAAGAGGLELGGAPRRQLPGAHP